MSSNNLNSLSSLVMIIDLRVFEPFPIRLQITSLTTLMMTFLPITKSYNYSKLKLTKSPIFSFYSTKSGYGQLL